MTLYIRECIEQHCRARELTVEQLSAEMRFDLTKLPEKCTTDSHAFGDVLRALLKEFPGAPLHTIIAKPTRMVYRAAKWSSRRVPLCLPCKTPFSEGQEIRCHAGRWYCLACYASVLQKKTEQEHADVNVRRSTGTGKRRRAGGHGHAGGDGFVDL